MEAVARHVLDKRVAAQELRIASDLKCTSTSAFRYRPFTRPVIGRVVILLWRGLREGAHASMKGRMKPELTVLTIALFFAVCGCSGSASCNSNHSGKNRHCRKSRRRSGGVASASRGRRGPTCIQRAERLVFPGAPPVGGAAHAIGPHEAEIVYRDDLKRNPANGWALYGLSAALKAERKTAEATEAARQFESAWSHADIRLTASAF